MKVLESLKELNDDVKLKVGSKDGSSFWYMGTVGDFRDNIVEYNDRAYKYATQKRNRAYKSFQFTVENPMTPDHYVRKQLKTEAYPSYSYKDYIDKLNKWFESLTRKQKTLKSANDELENYVKLKKRSSVNLYYQDPLVDELCAILIIEGCELGGFWLFNEAESLPATAFAAETKDEEDVGS